MSCGFILDPREVKPSICQIWKTRKWGEAVTTPVAVTPHYESTPPPNTDTDINSCVTFGPLLVPADTSAVATFRHRTSCPVIFYLQSPLFPCNVQAPVQTAAPDDFPLFPKTKAKCDAVQSRRSVATKCTLMKTRTTLLVRFRIRTDNPQPVSRKSLRSWQQLNPSRLAPWQFNTVTFTNQLSCITPYDLVHTCSAQHDARHVSHQGGSTPPMHTTPNHLNHIRPPTPTLISSNPRLGLIKWLLPFKLTVKNVVRHFHLPSSCTCPSR
jgi:hypothetical protein